MKWILVIAVAVCVALLILWRTKPREEAQPQQPGASGGTPADGTQDFAPFQIVDGTSLILDVSEYPAMAEIFLTREEDGFTGNGYDWEALAETYLREKCDAELRDALSFDSEAQTFCIYAKNEAILRTFAVGFSTFCKDTAAVKDLLSRTEPA